MAKKHPSIRPHEGKELELMLSGEKPLALYFSFYPIPEEFEPYLASGQLFRTDICSIFNYQGKPYDYQIVSHSPDDPNIQKLVTLKQLNGFDDDVERTIGKLLGYKAEDVEYYIQHHRASVEKYPMARISPIPNAKAVSKALGF